MWRNVGQTVSYLRWKTESDFVWEYLKNGGIVSGFEIDM